MDELRTSELIQKDLVDPEKLQTVLTDATLDETSELKRALEKVALLEAQLKDMNPNLDSIAEYDRFLLICMTDVSEHYDNNLLPLSQKDCPVLTFSNI
ncbi:hypothetical protein CASFOL_026917 [Castilleja foliolosa]|uniref:Uncharacterized protein n=1 Tax=Castilleja foliolosa TaxID=1961234 RepID=A0ABD3CLS2_9LAMI